MTTEVKNYKMCEKTNHLEKLIERINGKFYEIYGPENYKPVKRKYIENLKNKYLLHLENYFNEENILEFELQIQLHITIYFRLIKDSILLGKNTIIRDFIIDKTLAYIVNNIYKI